MSIIIINGNEIRAREGANLLWTALDNGFFVPNLCAIRGIERAAASCRLCYVEIEGEKAPVPACVQSIRDGMTVQLDTPDVARLRNTAFEFLMSHHHLECHICPKHKHCALQDIASHIGAKLSPHRVRKIARDLPVDSSHPRIRFDPNKCVLCGRCVYVCQEQGSGTLDFSFRSIETRVSTFANTPLGETNCNSCLACAAVCPVGSLTLKPSA
jgi:bidirectional [NiFe] hydrogenase diaphorase subunit